MVVRRSKEFIEKRNIADSGVHAAHQALVRRLISLTKLKRHSSDRHCRHSAALDSKSRAARHRAGFARSGPFSVLESN
jgi:hypothetical protein